MGELNTPSREGHFNPPSGRFTLRLVTFQAVEEDGAHLLMGELQLATSDQSPEMRIGAAELAGVFASTNKNVEMEEHVPALMQLLLGLFADTDARVLKVAWTALGQ
eukprot:194748-Prorocentrum_minimum.AAC.1